MARAHLLPGKREKRPNPPLIAKRPAQPGQPPDSCGIIFRHMAKYNIPEPPSQARPRTFRQAWFRLPRRATHPAGMVNTSVKTGHEGEPMRAVRANLKGCCAGCAVPSALFKSVQAAASLALPQSASMEIKAG